MDTQPAQNLGFPDIQGATIKYFAIWLCLLALIPAAGFTQSVPTTAVASSTLFTLSGGVGTITVTADSGVPWNVNISSPWLAITDPGAGAGSGTLSFSVQPNSDAEPRTGVITIAGQTVTIRQSGPINGAYRGLLTPAGSTGIAGRINISLTERGTFTGSLVFGTKTKAFSGRLTNGTCSLTLKLSSQISPQLTLSPDVSDTYQVVQVTLTQGADTFVSTTERVLHADKRVVPPQILGRYTFTLSQPSDTSLPQGRGWLAGSLSTAGTSLTTGQMGDGTPITGSCVLLEDLTALIFANPYAAGGRVTGVITFTANAGSTIAGAIEWIKPARGGKNPITGFDTVVSLNGESYLSFEKAVATFGSTATLTFSGIDPTLTPPSVDLIFNNNGHVTSSDKHVAVTLNQTAGTFAGTVHMSPKSSVLHFSGSILQLTVSGVGLIKAPAGPGVVTIAASPSFD